MIYQSKKYGAFKIIEDIKWDNVLIEFIDTGYQLRTRRDKIKSGVVKDILRPTIEGVGYIGGSVYTPTNNPKIYDIWHTLLRRCYSPKHIHYNNYGGRGVSVHADWHNFQNFAEWYINQNAPEDFQLDKDIIKDGNKIYSPEFCRLVSRQENIEKACAITAFLISPDGVLTSIYNLSKFSRDNNLTASAISAVLKGKRNQHKGWTKP